MTVIIVDAKHGILTVDRAKFRNGVVNSVTKIFKLEYNGRLMVAALTGRADEKPRMIEAFLSGRVNEKFNNADIYVLAPTGVLSDLYPEWKYGSNKNTAYTTYILGRDGLLVRSDETTSTYDIADYVMRKNNNTPSRSAKTMLELHEQGCDYVGYGVDIGVFGELDKKTMLTFHEFGIDSRFGTGGLINSPEAVNLFNLLDGVENPVVNKRQRRASTTK